MKKLVYFLFVLTAISCKKESSAIKDSQDSVIAVKDSLKIPDSVVAKDSVPQNKNPEISRQENGRVIIRVADGEKLPFTIDEKFTHEQDKLILRILNFEKTKINGTILPIRNEMNVRFNQIKLADGKMDGPFSREISYEISQPGEVILIIGKNNMADGEIEGQFSVTID